MVLKFKCQDSWNCECGREHHIPLQRVLFRNDLLSVIEDVMNDLNIGKRCLIVEDSTTKAVVGGQVEESLKRAGYTVDQEIVERADSLNVARVREHLHGFEFAVAVGGGTPIDVTKMATYEKDLPFISFPTALSHDGIASPIASITTNGVKESKRAQPPICVMADLGILLKAPSRMTAAGCGDLLAKLTSLKDWQLGRDEKGEYYCRRSAHLALQALHSVVRLDYAPRSLDQVNELADALVNCGVSMILAGSSRPASGAEHLFSHYLDRNASRPAMHGEQCALGTLLLAKYHTEYNPHWYDQPAYQWQNILRILERIMLPSKIDQLGIDRRLAVDALTQAARIRPERYTILHKRPISLAEARRLLEDTSAA